MDFPELKTNPLNCRFRHLCSHPITKNWSLHMDTPITALSFGSTPHSQRLQSLMVGNDFNLYYLVYLCMFLSSPTLWGQFRKFVREYAVMFGPTRTWEVLLGLDLLCKKSYAWSLTVGTSLLHGSLQNWVNVKWLWRKCTQRPLFYFFYLGHEGRVLNLVLSPDCSTMATVAADETIRIWKAFEMDPAKKKAKERMAKPATSVINQSIR